MSREKTAHFLLRLSLAFVFTYAAVSGMITPENWISYFPPPLAALAPATTLLTIFGLGELLLALWLLWGRALWLSSLLAGLALLGIVLTNLSGIEVLFRDLALALVAFALTVHFWPSRGRE